jgi:hypothetical protein
LKIFLIAVGELTDSVSIAARTFAVVSGLTLSGKLSTLETVCRETPASRATETMEALGLSIL